MRTIKLLLLFGGVAVAMSCNVNSAPELAGANPAGCRAAASASPSTATVAVGQSVSIALSVASGCPAPLLRNETPAIIQIDSGSFGSVRATGRSPGTGRLTVRSGADTLVATTVSITVTP